MSLEFISECAAVQYGDPDHLIIMFSSNAAVRRKSFDFKDYARDLPQTFLFLRETSVHTGFHNGILGLSNDLDETVEFLKYFIKKLGPKRVTMFGASIGGYAALIYGYLVGCDDVITVGTVTFVDPNTRDALNGAGERVPGAMEGMVEFYTSQGMEPRYLDAWPLIEANPDKVKAVRLYYTPEDAIDTTQSLHVARLPNIKAIPCPGTTHRYIGVMLIRDGTIGNDFANPVEEFDAAPA